MKKAKNLGVVLAGMALLVLTLNSPSSAAPTQNANIISPLTSGMVAVNVGNTPSVNVANTPTVNAQQSGVWMVDINGTALVRDVDNPALQPFQAGAVEVSASTSTCGGFETTLATVPAMKQLVIEHVSFGGNLPTGQRFLQVHVNNTAGGAAGVHDLPVALQGTGGGTTDFFAASQPVRLYADPGTIVTACFSRSASAGSATAVWNISGYHVDVP